MGWGGGGGRKREHLGWTNNIMCSNKSRFFKLNIVFTLQRTSGVVTAGQESGGPRVPKIC